MTDCIFCKIARGEAPSYTIYEDEEFMAILDIFPATKGYTLVIPKEHYRWVWDVENIGRYFEVCQKVANHMKKVLDTDSVYSMVLGEEVPHAHVRIFPANEPEFKDKLHKFIAETRPAKQIDSEEAKNFVEKLKLPRP
jgi:histidine triad (HIT) family protein